MEVISSEKKPIKFWIPIANVEAGAVEQAKNLANLPFTFHHVAIMPDTHQGYGMPIGGVLATEGVVIPNAVGVDIGCGMRVVKTSTKTSEFAPILKEFMGKVREAVPVGFNHHKDKCEKESMPEMPFGDSCLNMPVVLREYEKARYQLGSLGGGNHFIEIQCDQEDNVHFMIHSGSRNFGKQIADYYNEMAKNLNGEWYTAVPREWDLAFLPLDSQEGRSYIIEMDYALDFAKLNRRKMMTNLINIYMSMVNSPEIVFQHDVHHNYATMEHHFGKNVMVHRKGATSARLEQVGIIPGSQGTASYIVKGRGNPESFHSCSHGAGRKMSRTGAQKNLNLEEEKKKLDDKGIVHSIRSAKDLDEAAGAYKDIEEVMSNQADLVEVVAKLEPMGVIKG